MGNDFICFIQIAKDLRACYAMNRNLPYKKTGCKNENLSADKNVNSLYNCLKREMELYIKK